MGRRKGHRRPTKRGKGPKWTVVADGQGMPLAWSVRSASPAEVELATSVVEQAVPPERHTVLIADRAYDSDRLRASLREEGLEPVYPHRRGCRRKAVQNGRRLRRYRRRWIISEPSLGSVGSAD